jgi:hypothetical protein
MWTVVPRYTMQLQFRIFRIQYSAEGSSRAIGGNSTMLRALYCKPGAKRSAHPPVYDIWTVVPDICNVITAPPIQNSIFNSRYLRCYWWYLENSMSVILQTWCHIQRSSSSLRHLNCGPGHIQRTYSSAYVCFNIRWNVSALLLEIIGHLEARYTASLVLNTAHILQFTLCELWSRHIQGTYISAY